MEKKNILFLFGPSGSGKNSTINYLCSHFGISILFEGDLIQSSNQNWRENDDELEKQYSISQKFVFKAALMRSMNKIFKSFF